MDQDVPVAPELSAAQAAAALGVSLNTIHRWTEMGYLKGHRTATGQRRFAQSEIHELIGSLQRRRTGPDRAAS